MTTHKTTTGLIRACEKLIADLECFEFETYWEREQAEKLAGKKLDSLIRQCDSLWSNPADVEEFSILRNRLVDAWNAATWSA